MDVLAIILKQKSPLRNTGAKAEVLKLKLSWFLLGRGSATDLFEKWWFFCDSGGPDWLPPKKRIVSHEGPELTSFGPKSVTCLTGGPELTSQTFRLWHGKYWCLFLSSNAIILLPLYLWTSAANLENLENFLLRTAAVEGARFLSEGIFRFISSLETSISLNLGNRRWLQSRRRLRCRALLHTGFSYAIFLLSSQLAFVFLTCLH